MAENQIENETLQGAVAFIGLFVILPLCYFDKIEFAWTGVILWVILSLILSGILSHFQPQIDKKKAEDEDFDLAGLGALIWKSDEGVPVNFSYTDAKGKKSDRKVVLHKIFKDSKTRFYFEGYCQLRRAERTFNSEKIELLHNTDGEILEMPDFINNLVGYEAFGSAEIRKIEE